MCEENCKNSIDRWQSTFIQGQTTQGEINSRRIFEEAGWSFFLIVRFHSGMYNRFMTLLPCSKICEAKRKLLGLSIDSLYAILHGSDNQEKICYKDMKDIGNSPSGYWKLEDDVQGIWDAPVWFKFHFRRPCGFLSSIPKACQGCIVFISSMAGIWMRSCDADRFADLCVWVATPATAAGDDVIVPPRDPAALPRNVPEYWSDTKYIDGSWLKNVRTF